MKCVFCGTENDDNNFFCLTCGRRIGPAVLQESPQYTHFKKMTEQDMENITGPIDFSTPEGIRAIPKNADIYRCRFIEEWEKLSTYLRRLGFRYEEAGDLEMAISCMEKSNEIRATCREGYKKDDYYSFVRLLARANLIERAHEEKEKIDQYFSVCGSNTDGYGSNPEIRIKNVLYLTDCFQTDLVIMSPLGASCPECAKYQGRVFSLHGIDKRFPTIPEGFWKYGAIHLGCSHTFHPFIYGFSNPDLEYTLSIQKISNPQYTTDIIAFSNRPFVDDRPLEDIERALQYREERRLKEEHAELAADQMIAFEAFRGEEKRTYKWLQQNLPDLCPKSYSGYRRMKTQNTRNFQRLQAAAKALGKEL